MRYLKEKSLKKLKFLSLSNYIIKNNKKKNAKDVEITIPIIILEDFIAESEK